MNINPTLYGLDVVGNEVPKTILGVSVQQCKLFFVTVCLADLLGDKPRSFKIEI